MSEREAGREGGEGGSQSDRHKDRQIDRYIDRIHFALISTQRSMTVHPGKEKAIIHKTRQNKNMRSNHLYVIS